MGAVGLNGLTLSELWGLCWLCSAAVLTWLLGLRRLEKDHLQWLTLPWSRWTWTFCPGPGSRRWTCFPQPWSASQPPLGSRCWAWRRWMKPGCAASEKKKGERKKKKVLLVHSLFYNQVLGLVFILAACKLLGDVGEGGWAEEVDEWAAPSLHSFIHSLLICFSNLSSVTSHQGLQVTVFSCCQEKNIFLQIRENFQEQKHLDFLWGYKVINSKDVKEKLWTTEIKVINWIFALTFPAVRVFCIWFGRGCNWIYQ